MKTSSVRPNDYIEFFAELPLLGPLSACPGGDFSSEHSSDAACGYPLLMQIFKPDPTALESWQPLQPTDMTKATAPDAARLPLCCLGMPCSRRTETAAPLASDQGAARRVRIAYPNHSVAAPPPSVARRWPEASIYSPARCKISSSTRLSSRNTRSA